MSLSCLNCLYFRHHDRNGGSCHRFPPSFAGEASPKENHHWKFPVVNSHNWCGEYRENGRSSPLPEYTPE